MRREAAALLAVVAALALGACGGSGMQAGPAGSSSGGNGPDGLPPGLAGRPATRIALTDARGGTIDTRTLAGRPYAVTFLYTECPDVCPLIGEEIRQALTQMGAQAARVAVVAVSVDPRHDTAPAVRSWLARHREPSNFHYAIGTRAQLAPVWKGYFAAPQIPGDPQSAHTAVVWIVDRQGRLAGKLDAGTSFDPAELAKRFRALLGA